MPKLNDIDSFIGRGNDSPLDEDLEELVSFGTLRVTKAQSKAIDDHVNSIKGNRAVYVRELIQIGLERKNEQ